MGTNTSILWFYICPPPRNKMRRSLPNFAAMLAVLTVAFVLFTAKLTNGASRATDGPVGAPSFDAQVANGATEDTAVFAGGCFWGVEAVYDHVKGVKRTISGYAGGDLANPSYEQVSTGDTGHAESVEVIYDPSQVSYGKLLTTAKTFSRPIVTQVAKLRGFYPAEAYHQNYLAQHPNQLYIVINDQPKVANLKKQFSDIY